MIKNILQESQIQRHIALLKNVKREILRVMKNLLPDENIIEQITKIFDSELARYNDQLQEFLISKERKSFHTIGKCHYIGREFIAARISLGWSHDDLAKRSGVSRSTIQDYERQEYEQAAFRRIMQIEKALMRGFEEEKQSRQEVLPQETNKLRVSKNEGSSFDNQMDMNPLNFPTDHLKNLRTKTGWE